MTEEQCDVLDKDGNKTGQTLPKSEVHDKELWHGSAFIWIYNSRGELLLQFRAANKKLYANVWDVSAAGHMSSGDGPIMTAARELQEELGIIAHIQDLTLIGKCKDEARMITGKMHREYDWIFLMPAEVDRQQLVLQESEVTNAKWLSVDQIERDLKKSDWEESYAGRNQYVYRIAITNVRKKLAK